MMEDDTTTENSCCDSSCNLEAGVTDCDHSQTGYTLSTGAPKTLSKADLLGMLLVVPEIDDARKLKWEYGVKTHRGGDASKPFVGDPIAELHAEGLDGLCYLEVIRAEGLLDDECFMEGCECAMGLVMLARFLNKNEG